MYFTYNILLYNIRTRSYMNTYTRPRICNCNSIDDIIILIIVSGVVLLKYLICPLHLEFLFFVFVFLLDVFFRRVGVTMDFIINCYKQNIYLWRHKSKENTQIATSDE